MLRCTRVEDAIAIASLYRSLVRYLDRNLDGAPRVTKLERAIANENKWRAQRYGVDCTFAGESDAIPLRDVLAQVISTIEADARELGCLSEVKFCQSIVDRGTAADEQLRIAKSHGDSLEAVTQWIANTTLGQRALDVIPPRSGLDEFSLP
jgi:carboxylate-amine ligase